ncbi:MAG: hypothetical protein DRH15_15545, partial [Deltaproteobacteria bacterium]
ITYKKGKQKAKVVVANKLAHIIWGVLKYKQPYRPKKRLIIVFMPQATDDSSGPEEPDNV